ncbi:hypothetical protein GCM10022409_45660 [Hymenobacter glaciei]|uniref:MFS transporter n=1 Tax=Hymenobacter glaciei TaxID=877209 RepID=A0ABP7UUX2_9BACT
MTDADFHQAIRRIRWVHWYHYPVQGLLMGAAVLVTSGRAAVGQTVEPQLATWPALLLLGVLVPVVSICLYMVYKYMRPNLRHPSEVNLRTYLGRVFLRNSLLCMAALPLLASYAITHKPFDLLASAGVLLALSWRLVPTAKTYQRWLIS